MKVIHYLYLKFIPHPRTSVECGSICPFLSWSTAERAHDTISPREINESWCERLLLEQLQNTNRLLREGPLTLVELLPLLHPQHGLFSFPSSEPKTNLHRHTQFTFLREIRHLTCFPPQQPQLFLKERRLRRRLSRPIRDERCFSVTLKPQMYKCAKSHWQVKYFQTFMTAK